MSRSWCKFEARLNVSRMTSVERDKWSNIHRIGLIKYKAPDDAIGVERWAVFASDEAEACATVEQAIRGWNIDVMRVGKAEKVRQTNWDTEQDDDLGSEG